MNHQENHAVSPTPEVDEEHFEVWSIFCSKPAFGTVPCLKDKCQNVLGHIIYISRDNASKCYNCCNIDVGSSPLLGCYIIPVLSLFLSVLLIKLQDGAAWQISCYRFWSDEAQRASLHACLPGTTEGLGSCICDDMTVSAHACRTSRKCLSRPRRRRPAGAHQCSAAV